MTAIKYNSLVTSYQPARGIVDPVLGTSTFFVTASVPSAFCNDVLFVKVECMFSKKLSFFSFLILLLRAELVFQYVSEADRRS